MAGPRPELPSLIRGLLRRAEASYPDVAHRLWDVWEEAVGAEVARRAYPLELRRGRLTLAVESAPWMQQLSMLRETLRESVNAALGAELVREIRFRNQPPAPPPPARHRAPPPAWLDEPPPTEALAAIEEQIASVADPALRETLRQVRVRAEQVRRFREAREEPPPPPSSAGPPRRRAG